MKQRGASLEPLAGLDDLRSLVDRQGPFLSVYLCLRPATEELAKVAELEWQAAREQAITSGAPGGMLDAFDDIVRDAHRDAAGLCLLSSPHGPAHVETLQTPPRILVRWEQVPILRPLLAARQHRQPVLVVLVDRLGADLMARYECWPSIRTTVTGASYPTHKAAAGGWSQRRNQQHAEETWHHNMTDVAEEVSKAADRFDARLIAIGGDEHALSQLYDQLRPEARKRLWSISITRANDGSFNRLDREVAEALQRWVDARLRETVSVYAEELGQHDRAVAGHSDTFAALRAAQVAVLLVRSGTLGDGRRGWLGATARDAALEPDGLVEADKARAAPLMELAVCAALATGADVRVLPQELAPTDGLGAILRW